MFLPVFDWIGTLNCSEHQNKTIFGAKQVNSGKIRKKTKVNKQLAAMFWA